MCNFQACLFGEVLSTFFHFGHVLLRCYTKQRSSRAGKAHLLDCIAHMLGTPWQGTGSTQQVFFLGFLLVWKGWDIIKRVWTI